MLILAALLLSAPQYQASYAPPPPRSGGFAPTHRSHSPPPRRSPTSRVRGWTIEQRVCEKRRNGSCMMTAPDLLKPDVAPKVDR